MGEACGRGGRGFGSDGHKYTGLSWGDSIVPPVWGGRGDRVQQKPLHIPAFVGDLGGQSRMDCSRLLFKNGSWSAASHPMCGSFRVYGC